MVTLPLFTDPLRHVICSGNSRGECTDAARRVSESCANTLCSMNSVIRTEPTRTADGASQQLDQRRCTQTATKSRQTVGESHAETYECGSSARGAHAWRRSGLIQAQEFDFVVLLASPARHRWNFFAASILSNLVTVCTPKKLLRRPCAGVGASEWNLGAGLAESLNLSDMARSVSTRASLAVWCMRVRGRNGFVRVRACVV